LIDEANEKAVALIWPRAAFMSAMVHNLERCGKEEKRSPAPPHPYRDSKSFLARMAVPNGAIVVR